MRLFYLYVSFIFLLTSCSSFQQETEYLVVDTQGAFSKVQLDLKDIANVEYIKLETDTNCIVNSRPMIYSDNYLILLRTDNGEIVFFDHQGKFQHKFSHKGNGPHEYLYITNLRLDEKRKEIYVHDSFKKNIFVYDLKGNFIREYTSSSIRFLYTWDTNEFITYDVNFNNTDEKPYYTLLSKENGIVDKKIDLPYSFSKKHDLSVNIKTPKGTLVYTDMHLPVVRYDNGYILNELATDTIYRYSFEGDLKSFIVRTPSLSSDDHPIYLQYGGENQEYLFLRLVSINKNDEENMFPSTYLVYNKKNKDISEYKLINEDYSDMDFKIESDVFNGDFYGYGLKRLRTDELLEALEKNKLSGKLKEIAKTLNEDDNDIIMVLKLK